MASAALQRQEELWLLHEELDIVRMREFEAAGRVNPWTLS